MNTLLTLIAAVVVFQAEAGAARDAAGPVFRPRRVIPRQPPIVRPPVVAADKVTKQVDDRELVLGVVVKDQARAYPINMLTGPRREIINDTLGNRPIAATW